MGLNRIRLGDLIKLSEAKNSDLKYGINDVKGVSIKKEFIETKADMTGVSLKPYLLVKPNYFCYVPVTSRNGNKITISLNMTKETYIVSSSYVVFHVIDEEAIDPKYLFMVFNRGEFDRYSRFHSWGSAREVFSFEEMCELVIDLPSIDIQRKYVAIYEALLANMCSYEKGLDDLKLVCDGYIEDLRRNHKAKEIGPYMIRGAKNSAGVIDNVIGVGQSGFIKPQKKPNESLTNYKIINKNSVCYAPPLYNILSDAIHVYKGDEQAVCSPIYEVFDCDKNLNPDYLLLWLKRDEFKRYAEFYALGVRNTFDYDLMKEVKIPIPERKVQDSIVQILYVYQKRKEYFDSIKNKISSICPVLIQGSILEAKGGN